MTPQEFSVLLHGREYGKEITEAEELEAKRLGLVVVFGYSDDNAEFRGAIDAEAGCYNGGEIRIHRKGLLASHEDPCDCQFCGYQAIAAKCAVIHAVWDVGGYAWTYRTEIPHYVFDIMDNGQKFCRGILFHSSELPTL